MAETEPKVRRGTAPPRAGCPDTYRVRVLSNQDGQTATRPALDPHLAADARGHPTVAAALPAPAVRVSYSTRE
jgi:hypothetical protein